MEDVVQTARRPLLQHTPDSAIKTMRIHRSTLSAALLSSVVSLAAAASAWGFSDATITVHGKGGGVGSGLTEKYSLGST